MSEEISTVILKFQKNDEKYITVNPALTNGKLYLQNESGEGGEFSEDMISAIIYQALFAFMYENM